jgi:hypothetical protein
VPPKRGERELITLHLCRCHAHNHAITILQLLTLVLLSARHGAPGLQEDLQAQAGAGGSVTSARLGSAACGTDTL